MQRTIAFYHDKDVDMLKLGCTLPNLANICLHKSTDANTYPITEANKDILEKTLWLPIYRFYTQSMLMKLLSESLQTYEKPLLGLMPANYTPTRCSNPCPSVFIRNGVSIQKPVDSHLDKQDP